MSAFCRWLGTAQQTTHYEGGRVRFAAGLLPLLAETLHASIDELIGEETKPKAGKRGPTPRIQQQLERQLTPQARRARRHARARLHARPGQPLNKTPAQGGLLRCLSALWAWFIAVEPWWFRHTGFPRN